MWKPKVFSKKWELLFFVATFYLVVMGMLALGGLVFALLRFLLGG